MESYWEAIEPLFSSIETGQDMESYRISIDGVSRPAVLLFAAHMCLAEVHNGGFLQLFWNSSGILVPEGIEGFTAIGMPTMTAILKEAALPLGVPYPRDRDERWDALLMASKYSSEELTEIFGRQENLYLAFVEATKMLPFDEIERRFWTNAETENGGFQDAATRYARLFNRVQ